MIMKSLTYFKALSDETRLRLINILIYHELSVNEIVALMKMGQSRISRHLKILMHADLVKCRRDGVWAFYQAVKKGSGNRFIDAVRYLLNDDPVFQNDLLRATHILEERKRRATFFFNAIASEWDLLKQEILGDFDLNAAILDLADTCGTAVDLGCGTGDLLFCLKAGAQQAIGVDSSSKMLDIARKRFQHHSDSVEFRLGELEHLPLCNEEADLATLSMVLHHLPCPESALAEIHRILKPGGMLTLADFDKHTNESMRKNYGDHRLGFSVSEIEQLLSANSFELNRLQTHELQQSLKINIYQAIKINYHPEQGDTDGNDGTGHQTAL